MCVAVCWHYTYRSYLSLLGHTACNRQMWDWSPVFLIPGGGEGLGEEQTLETKGRDDPPPRGAGSWPLGECPTSQRSWQGPSLGRQEQSR